MGTDLTGLGVLAYEFWPNALNHKINGCPYYKTKSFDAHPTPKIFSANKHMMSTH
jgi:hypothetical protein